VTALLPAAMGARRAAAFTLTDGTLTAADWGIVIEVTTPDALTARVDELAQVVAARPGASAGETARLLRHAVERSYIDQLDDEAASIGRIGGSDEAAVLINAFVRR
jgi:2-(1,2-epoxy-1,2-dihydrophenyl)acetyl-CoA isomerase